MNGSEKPPLTVIEGGKSDEQEVVENSDEDMSDLQAELDKMKKHELDLDTIHFQDLSKDEETDDKEDETPD
ncbi:hypothetical protein N9L26_01195 [Candidatus Pacebacteria bacterium]|nr:hypothetical protein [Candidatus Paceibacterota bacterium]